MCAQPDPLRAGSGGAPRAAAGAGSAEGRAGELRAGQGGAVPSGSAPAAGSAQERAGARPRWGRERATLRAAQGPAASFARLGAAGRPREGGHAERPAPLQPGSRDARTGVRLGTFVRSEAREGRGSCLPAAARAPGRQVPGASEARSLPLPGALAAGRALLLVPRGPVGLVTSLPTGCSKLGQENSWERITVGFVSPTSCLKLEDLRHPPLLCQHLGGK